MSNFKIESQTAKAKKLSDGEVTFWVQNRWVREDGTLTAKGVESYEAAKAKVKNGMDSESRIIDAVILRETDRAVLIRYIATYKSSGGEVEDWIPKSAFDSIDNGVLKPWGFKMLQEKVAARIGGLAHRVKIA